MRAVRWLVVVVLMAWCLPLLGCAKDTVAPASPPTGSPPAKDKDKDK